jgi:hypothetical protein
MTDYFIRFSYPLDVSTPANVARAFDIVAASIGKNGRENPPAEPFLPSLTPEHGITRLCLRDSGSADPQLLNTFIAPCTEAFGLTGCWGFQWAGIASDSAIDGCLGGAHILDQDSGRTVAWTSSCHWLVEGGAR